MTIDFEHAGSGPSAPEDPRAKRQRAKEQRRLEKAAARARRDTELAMTAEETLGVLLRFRVFKDGTIAQDAVPGTSLSKLLENVNHGMGTMGGLLPASGATRPRSPLLSADLVDHRVRKPFARARTVADDVTLGFVGGGRDHFGGVSLTIVTNDWAETVRGSSRTEVAKVLGLNELIQRAIKQQLSPGSGASSGSTELELTVDDIPAALRQLKALHDEGLLSDEEYESRRQVVLSHLPASPQPAPSAHVTPPPPPSAGPPPLPQAGSPAQVSPPQVIPPPQAGPPPGWHLDPHGRARLRWWDGTRWTDHTAP